MADVAAASRETTEIVEFHPSRCRQGTDNRDIKVDQMRMVGASARDGTDSVRIVTRRARCISDLKVPGVFWKALVAQDARTAMTFVAQSIIVLRLGCVITDGVVAFQQEIVYGAVRTVRTSSTRPWAGVIIVAVAASNKCSARDGGI